MMKRRGLLFLLSLLIAIGVFLFFPKGGGEDFYFVTAWTKELPNRFVYGESVEEGTRVHPFSSRHFFGYFTDAGDVVYCEPIVYNVTNGAGYFINYSSVSETLLIKDGSGEIVTTIDEAGYPFIKNNRLFIFDIDRCGFSEWDFTGAKLWEKRYSSIITCFDCNQNETIIGLINGEILLYSQNGEYLYRDQPAGSRIQAVYGVAISPLSKHFGVVLGIDPQRLIVFQMRAEGYTPVYSEELKDTFRREVFIEFSSSEDYLFFEQNNALYRLNIVKKIKNPYPLIDRPGDVVFSEEARAHFIRSGGKEKSSIDVYSESGLYLSRFYVDPDSSFIIDGQAIYFQRSSVLHRVDIEGLDR